MYRCAVCPVVVGSGVPQMRFVFYREVVSPFLPNKRRREIASEIPVCERCLRLLQEGHPLESLRARFERPVPAPVPVLAPTPQATPPPPPVLREEVEEPKQEQAGGLDGILFASEGTKPRPPLDSKTRRKRAPRPPRRADPKSKPMTAGDKDKQKRRQENASTPDGKRESKKSPGRSEGGK